MTPSRHLPCFCVVPTLSCCRERPDGRWPSGGRGHDALNLKAWAMHPRWSCLIRSRRSGVFCGIKRRYRPDMRTGVEPPEAEAAGVDAAPVMASAIVAATAASLPHQAKALQRARAFAEPLLANEQLDTGENILAHADAVADILRNIGGSEAMQAVSYLVYACQHLNRPHEVIAKAFGDTFAALAVETTKLVQLQRLARSKSAEVLAKKLEERQVAQDLALP